MTCSNSVRRRSIRATRSNGTNLNHINILENTNLISENSIQSDIKYYTLEENPSSSNYSQPKDLKFNTSALHERTARSRISLDSHLIEYELEVRGIFEVSSRHQSF